MPSMQTSLDVNRGAPNVRKEAPCGASAQRAALSPNRSQRARHAIMAMRRTTPHRLASGPSDSMTRPACRPFECDAVLDVWRRRPGCSRMHAALGALRMRWWRRDRDQRGVLCGNQHAFFLVTLSSRLVLLSPSIEAALSSFRKPRRKRAEACARHERGRAALKSDACS